MTPWFLMCFISKNILTVLANFLGIIIQPFLKSISHDCGNTIQLSGAKQKLSKWCNGNLSSIGLNTLSMTQCAVIVSLVLENYIYIFFSIHHEWYIFHLKIIIIYLSFLWTRLRWNYISFSTQCKLLMTRIEQEYFSLSICICLFLAGHHISFVAYFRVAYDLASKVRSWEYDI